MMTPIRKNKSLQNKDDSKKLSMLKKTAAKKSKYDENDGNQINVSEEEITSASSVLSSMNLSIPNTIKEDSDGEHHEGSNGSSNKDQLQLHQQQQQQQLSKVVSPSSTGPTPPPSGISSKSVPKPLTSNSPNCSSSNSPTSTNTNIEKMFETFVQSPSGEFKPTFYNPFQVRNRRRTSNSQFKVLERAFYENCKPSAGVRKALAAELNLTTRDIQVWFQNRRAKLKKQFISSHGKISDEQLIEYLSLSSNNSSCEGGLLEDDSDDIAGSNSMGEFHINELCNDEANININNSKNIKNSTATHQNIAQESSTIFNDSRKRSLPAIPSQIPMKPISINVPGTEIMPSGQVYPNQMRSRSYSLPTIERSPQLPFKELREALFGDNNTNNNSNRNSANQQSILRSQQAQAQSQLLAQIHAQALTQQEQQGRMFFPQDTYLESQVYFQPLPQPQPHQSLTLESFQLPRINAYIPTELEQQQQGINPNQVINGNGNGSRRRGSFSAGNSTPSSNSNALFSLNQSRQNRSIPGSLSSIKEDSNNTAVNNQSNNNVNNNNGTFYYDSIGYTAGLMMMDGVDLDYFMNSDQISISSGNNDLISSAINSSPIENENLTCDQINAAASDSTHHNPVYNYQNHNHSSNFLTELSFMPQTSNEILLSTLIDDHHMLL